MNLVSGFWLFKLFHHDLIKGQNTLRGDSNENPIKRYYDLPLPSNKILATYIWVDATGETLRYKDRTLDFIPKKPKDKFTKMIDAWNNKLLVEEMLSKMTYSQAAKYLPPNDYFFKKLDNIYRVQCRLPSLKTAETFDENIKDLPILSFDGFATQQSTIENSDVMLCPRAIYRNPFRNGNHLLVMCDTYDRNREPLPTNHRVKCDDAHRKCREDEPWFGIEQEFFFLNRSDSRPLGWPKGGYPRRAEHYYCGTGADKIFARDIVNAHYRCCLHAGIPMYGINAEIGPSQWEYQIGPSVGVDAGDDLWIARFILEMLAWEYGVQVSLDPKPFTNWEGSGAHTNFSTKKMREENGIEEIEKAIRKLETVHDKHIKAYDPHGGLDNMRRLTGFHETALITDCSAGIAERYCSIRIPRLVAEDKKGYLEDRRPASNCDPYSVTDALMRTCILNEY